MEHSELVTIITKQIGREPKPKELGEIIGLSKEAIRSRKSRRANYSYEEMLKIGDFYGVNFFHNRLDDYVDSLATSVAQRKMQEFEKKELGLTPNFNIGVQYEFERWGKRLLILQVESGMLESSDFAKFLDIPENDLDDYIMKSKYPKGEHLVKMKIRFSEADFDWVLFGKFSNRLAHNHQLR